VSTAQPTIRPEEARRHARQIIFDADCPGCGHRLATPRIWYGQKAQWGVAHEETTRLCVRCVVRLLLRAALAHHGHVLIGDIQDDDHAARAERVKYYCARAAKEQPLFGD